MCRSTPAASMRLQVRVAGERGGDADLDAGEVGRDDHLAGVGGDAGADAALPGHLLQVRAHAAHAAGVGAEGVDGRSGPSVAAVHQLGVRLEEQPDDGLVVLVVQAGADQVADRPSALANGSIAPLATLGRPVLVRGRGAPSSMSARDLLVGAGVVDAEGLQARRRRRARPGARRAWRRRARRRAVRRLVRHPGGHALGGALALEHGGGAGPGAALASAAASRTSLAA
jgi:hypothetical protein